MSEECLSSTSEKTVILLDHIRRLLGDGVDGQSRLKGRKEKEERKE
jgi:hypothetical protein